MKKFFKFLGILLLVIILGFGALYLTYNESLPEGKSGDKAEELALKMATALNKEAFDATEVLEWSFRNKNHYKWYKKEGKVDVTLGDKKIKLNLLDNSKSIADSPELIEEALKNFNNDSFWLIAPYKIFDDGVERKLVNYDGKDALLITYTFGGSTPGDSYLWILDENFLPVSYKMWASIIPVGGISATWNDLKKSESGIYLPSKHTLSLFDMEIDMGNVKASNPKADELANKVLKALKHDAYKKTRFLEWSFAGRRNFKWDKQEHKIDVSWKNTEVTLYPNQLEKSIVVKKEKEAVDSLIIRRALNAFNNDSFWLVAPHKLFDYGTIRSTEMIDGKEALRIKYTTGGTTPGDAYVWILDSNYVPTSYKMYLANKRMNGTPATWEDWITTESGTLLPKMHTFGKNRKLSMGDVKGYN